MKLLVIVSMLFWFGNAEAQFDTSGCGATKLCIRNIAHCNVSQASCLFFSSAWNAVENTFSIEMSGGTGGGSQYYGVGFSPEGKMENSDVYLCLGNDLKLGGIGQRHTAPFIAGGSAVNGISDVTTSTSNGVAMCSFKREAAISKPISGNKVESFDLTKKDYFIIQARGSWQSRPLNHGGSNRWPSSKALPFTFPSAPTISTTTLASTSSQTRITVEMFSFARICFIPFGLSCFRQFLI